MEEESVAGISCKLEVSLMQERSQTECGAGASCQEKGAAVLICKPKDHSQKSPLATAQRVLPSPPSPASLGTPEVGGEALTREQELCELREVVEALRVRNHFLELRSRRSEQEAAMPVKVGRLDERLSAQEEEIRRLQTIVSKLQGAHPAVDAVPCKDAGSFSAPAVLLREDGHKSLAPLQLFQCVRNSRGPSSSEVLQATCMQEPLVSMTLQTACRPELSTPLVCAKPSCSWHPVPSSGGCVGTASGPGHLAVCNLYSCSLWYKSRQP